MDHYTVLHFALREMKFVKMLDFCAFLRLEAQQNMQKIASFFQLLRSANFRSSSGGGNCYQQTKVYFFLAPVFLCPINLVPLA
jgi:hypothetical protein